MDTKAAVTRIRAWVEAPVSKRAMWHPMSTYVSTFQATGDKVGDFLVRHHVEDDVWILVDGRAVVAKIELNVFKNTPSVLSAVVNPAYQGQGIGFDFYEYLLKRFRVLQSSIELSKGSALLWAKLVTKHKGHIVVPVSGARSIEVPVLGFKNIDGYQWPIVVQDGKKVCLGEIKGNTPAERAALRNFIYIVRA